MLPRKPVTEQDGLPWRDTLKRSLGPDIEHMARQVPRTGRKHNKGWKRAGPLRLKHLVCLGVAEGLWRSRKRQIPSERDVICSQYGRRQKKQEQQRGGLQDNMHFFILK